MMTAMTGRAGAIKLAGSESASTDVPSTGPKPKLLARLALSQVPLHAPLKQRLLLRLALANQSFYLNWHGTAQKQKLQRLALKKSQSHTQKQHQVRAQIPPDRSPALRETTVAAGSCSCPNASQNRTRGRGGAFRVSTDT